MSRRSPGRLRRQRPAPRRPLPSIDGLPSTLIHRVAVLSAENRRCPAPQSLATAVAALRWFLRNPGRVLMLHPDDTCPCHDPVDAVDTIHDAQTALPPRFRRQFAEHVAPLVEEFHARTLPNPHAPTEWPWWRRRCTEY